MFSQMDALCDRAAQLEPEAMFYAMWEMRERVMDRWCEAAERVIAKYFPDAKNIYPAGVLEARDGYYAVSMILEMQDGTSVNLPHVSHLYLVDGLTPDQQTRWQALQQGIAGAEPMSPDDALVTVLSETHGCPVEAFRVFLKAASDLVDHAVDACEPVISLARP